MNAWSDPADLAALERKVERSFDMLVGISRSLQRSGKIPRDTSLPGAQLVRDAALLVAQRGGDPALISRLQTRAAVSPALTTVPTWAAELHYANFAGFVLGLASQSAMSLILSRSPQVSLLGAGVQRVPVAGAAPPAKLIPEGQPIPVIKGAFSPLSLTAFKFSAISTFSNELARASNIEQVVRVLLGQSIGSGIDLAAFSATPPAGLLAGLTPIAASTSTDPKAALLADLAALLGALTGPSADVVFAMSPVNFLVASALLPAGFGYALASSSALAVGTVVAVDPQGIAAALTGEPRLSISEGASVHEEDTAGPINAGTMASPVRSLFQTDMVGLKTVADTGWIARAGAVAYLEGAAW